MTHITYEQAKKLKESGFPQGGKGEWIVGNNSSQDLIVATTCYIPTLSELIEACGDKFHGLSHYFVGKYSKGWFATGLIDDVDSFTEKIEGSTPEEAVLNLYIALHSK